VARAVWPLLLLLLVISVTRLRRLTGEIFILCREKIGVHGGNDDLGEIDPDQ
jgi:hypothetical protein